MKSILVPGLTLLIIVYVIMFFVDNRFWPEQNLIKAKNIFLILLAVYLSYNFINIYILKKQTEKSALVYKVASLGKVVYTKASDHIRPFKREFIVWTLVAVGLAFIGFLLVGMPGYLLLEIPVRFGISNKIQGDNAWPAAIFLSLIWPFCLPAGVLVKHFIISRGHVPYALMGWIGTTAGGILFLIMITYWMFGKKA